MGQIDLHVHSIRSDGTMTPKELVDYAVSKGLKAMALTDHDTVDGIDEIMEYAKDKPVEIIPGIEYSTQYNERDVHIVGLFIDHKAPVFLAYLARLRQSRIDRNHKLCANLRSAGIDITYEALLAAFPDAVITRAHYAKFLLDKGYVKSRDEAFERYLGDHTPYFVHREKVTPEEVIDVTRRAGGIPVLAHPTLYGLGSEQLDLLIGRLKAAGLMGIETYYSTYSPSEEKKIKALADKYGLLPSGGSDFHGENKPGLDLATGYGRLYIHEEVLAQMRRARETKILFTDLDGTLLTTEKKVSESTREKLLTMIRNGNSLVLASGRPVDSILEVLEELNIKEEVIQMQSEGSAEAGGIYATAYNGAVLYDCIRDEVIESYSVPMRAAQKLFDLAKERGLHIQTYADSHVVSIAEDAAIRYYTRVIHMPYVIGEQLEKELTHEPFKVLTID
ncbi:MAG: HAD hydrolase family protein, partial [Lachnospiraceae bacterium]|nr:HAD hydrolase family protein [Lachnospiraceae bacterium]